MLAWIVTGLPLLSVAVRKSLGVKTPGGIPTSGGVQGLRISYLILCFKNSLWNKVGLVVVNGDNVSYVPIVIPVTIWKYSISGGYCMKLSVAPLCIILIVLVNDEVGFAGFAYVTTKGIGVVLDNVLPVTPFVPNWFNVPPVTFTWPFDNFEFWKVIIFPTPADCVVPTLVIITITLSLNGWLVYGAGSCGFTVVVIWFWPVKYLSLKLNSFNFCGKDFVNGFAYHLSSPPPDFSAANKNGCGALKPLKYGESRSSHPEKILLKSITACVATSESISWPATLLVSDLYWIVVPNGGWTQILNQPLLLLPIENSGILVKFGGSTLYVPDKFKGAKKELDEAKLKPSFSWFASISAWILFSSKSSSISAFLQSHSQLLHSGYEIIGNPIRGNPLTFIAAPTAKAVKVKANATLNAATIILKIP